MVDENGAALYKVSDGAVTARTEAERARELTGAQPSIEQRVSALESDAATLTDVVNVLLGVT